MLLLSVTIVYLKYFFLTEYFFLKQLSIFKISPFSIRPINYIFSLKTRNMYYDNIYDEQFIEYLG